MIGKYFVPAPDKQVASGATAVGTGSPVVLVVGVALAAVGLYVLAGLVIAGFVVLALVAWRTLVRYREELAAAYPRASDAEMDDYLKQDVDRVADRALARLGLMRDDLELTSEEADPHRAHGPARRLAEQGPGPLTVFGPVLDPLRRCAIGDDEVWRFGAYEVMVVCPTAHHIGIYECVLDARTGTTRAEEIREYFYVDLAMISIVAEGPVDLHYPGLVSAGRRLPFDRTLLHAVEIVGVSGDRSGIIAHITESGGTGRRARLQESGLDRVVPALRTLLRNKKGRPAA